VGLDGCFQLVGGGWCSGLISVFLGGSVLVCVLIVVVCSSGS